MRSRRADAAPNDAHILINGRRWRTSDPSIPPRLRRELVNELMAARRAIKDASTARSRRAARDRVQDAKVALGERGRGWWLPRDDAAAERRIDAAIRALLRSRRPRATICPSEPARIIGGARWRSLLPQIRNRAAFLATAGVLAVLRNRRVVRRQLTAGVLRYRLVRSELEII
jgi:hypothetical protein